VVAEVIERGQLPDGTESCHGGRSPSRPGWSAESAGDDQLRIEVQEIHDGPPDDEQTAR